MANSRIRVILNGGEITGTSNDGNRIELYIPSGIEFRMEGDWGHGDRLSKREIKDLVNTVVDKVVEKIPSGPAPTTGAIANPIPTTPPAPSAEELENAYKQGMIDGDRAFREEVRMNIAANNAAIQEIGKSLQAMTTLLTTMVGSKGPIPAEPAPATVKKATK